MSKKSNKKEEKPERLDLETQDLTQKNIQKLTRIFPELLTEKEKEVLDENGEPVRDEKGNIKTEIIKTIDSVKLKELVGDYAEKDEEFYKLEWAGKQRSRQKILQSIRKTLRPYKEESVDFENTENLFLEGDNFEILKLLQESYLNKVKMIYIDPPYNTGNDFVYKDKYSISKEEYEEESGSVDEEGNKLVKNTTTSGRFHSDWLSMMYERLTVARDLLKDDGVIFISIDDNEVHNLREICDEIFGEQNFVGNFIRRTRSGGGFGTSDIGIEQDYVVCYSKNKIETILNKLKKGNRELMKYFNKKDEKGMYHLRDLRQSDNQAGRREDRPFMFYGFTLEKNGRLGIIDEEDYKKIYENSKFNDDFIKNLEKKYHKVIWPIRGDREFGRWTCGYKKARSLLEQNNLEHINGRVFNKERVTEDREDKVVTTLLEDNRFTNTSASKELKLLFEKDIFDFPKPVSLLGLLCSIATSSDTNDIVLDFFAGSATTAHAVMQLNAEDGGNRKFIMTQLPEKTEEGTEAYKAGYETISDIGKERIRRAAKKIKEDNKGQDLSNVDFGFRVFKTDSTNMKDVYYNPKKIDQKTLTGLKDNIKEDRTDEDLLYQVLLDLTVPISANVKREKIDDKKVFKVDDNFLVACFDNKIDLDFVKKLSELDPKRIVFKDSSFKDDATKVNVTEYIRNNLPNTILRVI